VEKTGSPYFAMVAGETSGDLLASILIPEFKNCWPNLEMSGIGGPQMISLGFHSLWQMEKLSVRGYVEVLKHYREIVRIRDTLKNQLLQFPPDLFIGIDAPDFNLDLARELRLQKIPTIQFVCPSIWAWRAHRVKKIKSSVDHVLCIFPFEPEILAENGIPSTFVGHPLAKLIPQIPDKDFAKKSLGLKSDDVVVVVLPGSRKDEINQMAPRFLKAVEIIQKKHPHIIPLLPVAPGMRQYLDRHIKDFPQLRHLKILNGQSHQCMAAADVAMVASGTATLETALFKCPMVISYAMPWLSWQITQAKRLQPWVGLPNIICKDFVVPEYLQSKATPTLIAQGVLDWLNHPAEVTHLQKIFLKMHQDLSLDTPRVAQHAIEKIISL
jgi:lipid-A-disaccharide synthase